MLRLEPHCCRAWAVSLSHQPSGPSPQSHGPTVPQCVGVCVTCLLRWENETQEGP